MASNGNSISFRNIALLLLIVAAYFYTGRYILNKAIIPYPSFLLIDSETESPITDAYIFIGCLKEPVGCDPYLTPTKGVIVKPDKYGVVHVPVTYKLIALHPYRSLVIEHILSAGHLSAGSYIGLFKKKVKLVRKEKDREGWISDRHRLNSIMNKTPWEFPEGVTSQDIFKIVTKDLMRLSS